MISFCCCCFFQFENCSFHYLRQMSFGGGENIMFLFSQWKWNCWFLAKRGQAFLEKGKTTLIQEYTWLKQETTLLTLGLYLCRENSWVLLIRKTFQSWLTGTGRAFVSPGLFCHSSLDNIKPCDRDKVHMTAVQARGNCKHLIESLSEIERFLKSNNLSS